MCVREIGKESEWDRKRECRESYDVKIFASGWDCTDFFFELSDRDKAK